jgi:predicted nuclease with RNAse H fold
MFFASVLEKLGQRGVWVFEQYPALTDKEAFVGASNIL